MTRLREQAFLNAGVHIVSGGQTAGQGTVGHLHYEGGIRLLWSTSAKTGFGCAHDDVIYLSAVDGGTTAEVALQYNDSYNA